MTARTGRTRLRWGGATDVGRVRSGNEDQFVARDDVGLWAVADGMGGHRGGEVASEIACDTIARAFDQHTIDGLVDAIEQANRAVFEAGARDPELTGMGTTVVALAVVEHEGDELLAIANVGDSRVYRYAGGELDQLTVDHSLVADLVREGSLSPEQAAVHPQRNIVTRVLGVHDDVPVDALGVEPHHGDRYVLCSDGLFNEVPEPQIAAVLRRLADPVDAVGELVRLALDRGGRDNVTVVIVDVVDDGGRSEAASAAVGADGEPARGAVVAERTAATGAYGDATGATDRTRRSGRRMTARSRRRGTTAAVPVVAAGTGADVDGDRVDDAEGYDDDYEDDSPGQRRGGGRRRRVTWRVVLFTFVLGAIIVGAVATIQWYGRSAYFVGFQGDQVAIFKGRPGGLLWIDPSLVTSTDLERDRVPPSRLRDIETGKEQASLADAQRYVNNISAEADELDPPTTTTTTTPLVPTVPPTAPTGSTLTPLTSTPAPAVPG